MIEINVKAKKTLWGPRLDSVAAIHNAVEAGLYVEIWKGDPYGNGAFYDHYPPHKLWDPTTWQKYIDKGYGFYVKHDTKVVVYRGIVVKTLMGALFLMKVSRSRAKLDMLISQYPQEKLLYQEDSTRYAFVKSIDDFVV